MLVVLVVVRRLLSGSSSVALGGRSIGSIERGAGIGGCLVIVIIIRESGRCSVVVETEVAAVLPAAATAVHGRGAQGVRLQQGGWIDAR